MKFVFFILCMVLLSFVFVSAANPLGSLDGTVDKIGDTREKVGDVVEDVGSTEYWEQKWDYLGNEGSKILLENPSVAKVDASLKKFSIVFNILFGAPYALSLALLFIIVLWIFFTINFSRLVGATGFFDGVYKWVGGILISVILAQTGFFKHLVIFFGNLVFSPDYSWMRVLVFFLIGVAFVLVEFGDRALAAYLKKKMEFSAEKKLKKIQEALLARETAREETSKLAD